MISETEWCDIVYINTAFSTYFSRKTTQVRLQGTLCARSCPLSQHCRQEPVVQEAPGQSQPVHQFSTNQWVIRGHQNTLAVPGFASLVGSPMGPPGLSPGFSHHLRGLFRRGFSLSFRTWLLNASGWCKLLPALTTVLQERAGTRAHKSCWCHWTNRWRKLFVL